VGLFPLQTTSPDALASRSVLSPAQMGRSFAEQGRDINALSQILSECSASRRADLHAATRSEFGEPPACGSEEGIFLCLPSFSLRSVWAQAQTHLFASAQARLGLCWAK
jgi:hypothetical protein